MRVSLLFWVSSFMQLLVLASLALLISSLATIAVPKLVGSLIDTCISYTQGTRTQKEAMHGLNSNSSLITCPSNYLPSFFLSYATVWYNHIMSSKFNKGSAQVIFRIAAYMWVMLRDKPYYYSPSSVLNSDQVFAFFLLLPRLPSFRHQTLRTNQIACPPNEECKLNYKLSGSGSYNFEGSASYIS